MYNKQPCCPKCIYYGNEYPYSGSCKALTEICQDGGNNNIQLLDVNGRAVTNLIVCVGSGFSCNQFVSKQ